VSIIPYDYFVSQKQGLGSVWEKPSVSSFHAAISDRCQAM